MEPSQSRFISSSPSTTIVVARPAPLVCSQQDGFVARANALENNVSLHFEGSGAAGAWTKADSVTAFDDFAYGTY